MTGHLHTIQKSGPLKTWENVWVTELTINLHVLVKTEFFLKTLT